MTEETVFMGDWLKVYKESDKIMNDIYITDDECILNVACPARYDEELPSFEDIPSTEKQTIADIHRYFIGILNDQRRIMVVNDQPLYGPIFFPTIRCDYCRVSDELWSYHCDECNKDMCSLCYKERTEEIALANGAKKWSDRKDALLACFQHEKEGKFSEKEIDTREISIYCDICGKLSRYDRRSVWSCNRRGGKDICLSCLNSETKKQQVRELMENTVGTWKFVDFSLKNDIGSILDWVPILYDSDDNGVLYNMNPDSSRYHEVVLSAMDNHDREGYFSYSSDLGEVLDKLRDGSTIHNLLQDAGHSTYYG